MQKWLEKQPALFSAIVLAISFLVIDATRPPLPIDETRYLTVAWEYYVRGNFILPTLNYLPYHHKPPMLFWLIDIFWAIFGTHVWAARFVPLMACVASIFMTGKIALKLFPDLKGVRPLSCLLLLGGLPFIVYGPMIMFDWLLTSVVLLGIYALIGAAQTAHMRSWFLFALALALGGLIKGPAILLHLLPLALLMPFWAEKSWDISLRDWVAGIILCVFAAVGLVLLWATPAVLQGGSEYAQMIFFGQTVGRVVESFDHARPFWWFAVLLPAYVVPWVFWPRVWTALRSSSGFFRHWPFRFLFFWVAPVFIAFSFISGKQIHYLFPILPGVSIFLAALLAYNFIDPSRMVRVAGRFVLVIVFVHLGVHMAASHYLHKYYALDDIAAVVAQAQENNRPIALARIYHGEIGYLAKVKSEMEPFTDIAQAKKWLVANPKGIIVTRYRDRKTVDGLHILFEQSYRSEGSYIAVLEKAKNE